jgi:hypothetical protein
MVADLLADHVDPGAVAQITVEVLDRELDYPRAVVDDLAPYSNRFAFAAGDGVAPARPPSPSRRQPRPGQVPRRGG